MKIIDHPSPNHGPRPEGVPVDILLVHYTGMPTMQDALQRLCDPAAQVSAHYMIDEDGTIYRLVDESRRAWHAGVGCWQGERDINSRSIGIELVNPGHEWGYRPFPPAQMEAFKALAKDICRRHAIPAARVLGHSDIAPARKQDPGELFDWEGLAKEGLGIWPDFKTVTETVHPDEAAALLSTIGYDVEVATLPITLRAFQRRFYPSSGIVGKPDGETLRRLKVVANYLNTFA